MDVLWDFSRTREGEGLMDAHTGQLVMREIVEDYLEYVTWADDGFPGARAALLPAIQSRPRSLSSVRAAHLRGQSHPGRDVANMLNAGEDPQVVADEHGVSLDDVSTAARALLGHAA